MNDHRDESLLDKIKNAFGMGDDGADASADEIGHDSPIAAPVSSSTPQAGFSEPFEEDLGDPTNRPTGPDYGATDAAPDVAVATGTAETDLGPAATRVDDVGVGFDEETVAATPAAGDAPRAGAAGYDDPYETVAGPGPMGAGTTAEDEAWTRGEAASGTSPFEADEPREGRVIEQERRETGI